MSVLHEPSISKTRKIFGYILSILPTGLITFSGINKIMGSEWVVASMQQIGLEAHTSSIGMLEIFCVILYWIPKTSNIGFFLLCSYAGGIIVAEMIGGMGGILGAAVATLLYVGTMLRKPFLSGLGF